MREIKKNKKKLSRNLIAMPQSVLCVKTIKNKKNE